MDSRSQFFPPEHKSYNMAINTDPQYLGEKFFACPICGKATRNIYPEISKLVTLGVDDDSRVHHKGIEDYYYDIIRCEHCWYTALREFYNQGFCPIHYFNQKIEPLKMTITFQPDKMKYTIDDVFFAYYFAISCVENCFLADDRCLIYAKLWMRISWLYADCKDSKMEQYALDKAHMYFMQAYSLSKPEDKTLQQLMITTAVVCYKKGDISNCRKLLSSAVNVEKSSEARKEKIKYLWKKYNFNAKKP